MVTRTPIGDSVEKIPVSRRLLPGVTVERVPSLISPRDPLLLLLSRRRQHRYSGHHMSSIIRNHLQSSPTPFNYSAVLGPPIVSPPLAADTALLDQHPSTAAPLHQQLPRLSFFASALLSRIASIHEHLFVISQLGDATIALLESCSKRTRDKPHQRRQPRQGPLIPSSIHPVRRSCRLAGR